MHVQGRNVRCKLKGMLTAFKTAKDDTFQAFRGKWKREKSAPTDNLSVTEKH